MVPGVSFQPSNGDLSQTDRERSPTGGVQEAVKILSLRLPKVVGAQGLAPSALLTSQGSGSNPRVDSVLNQVWQRMFPTGASPSSVTGPVMPTGASSNHGAPAMLPSNYGTPPSQPGGFAPRWDMPVREAPAMDQVPAAPRKPLPRITPGYEPPPVPRGDDPIFETPLPTTPPPAPARPLPSHAIGAWPDRYEL